MKEEAKALGCDCDRCPLAREPGPVLPEANAAASLILVGSAPDDTEVREGRPFVGAAGRLLHTMLAKAKIPRGEIHFTNAVLCQPPNNDMSRVLARIRTKNAEIRRLNNKINKEFKLLRKVVLAEDLKPLIPTPFDCCRPRLARELSSKTFALLAGPGALGTVMGDKVSLQAMRGSIIESDLLYDEEKNVLKLGDKGSGNHAINVIPIMHPDYVRKNARWTDTLRRDVDRMGRWRRGQLNWKAPKIIYNPTPAQLRAFLSTPEPSVYDVETDGIEPLNCNMRCIGIGNSDVVYLVGVRPKDADRSIRGDYGFYPEHQMLEIREILREWATNPNKLKIGHNAGYYDRLVLRQWLGVDVNPTLDSVLLHRLAESEMPHGLGFVASKYTDTYAWKASRAGKKLALEAESDHELHQYCGFDVSNTARVIEPLIADVRKADQIALIEKDHLVQRVCADMHHVGMYVNQKLRETTEKKLLHSIIDTRKQIQDQSRIPDFNPGSTQQLRQLLFTDWKIQPPLDDKFKFTASGDPSTSDDVMRSILSLDRLQKEHRDFILLIRKYRTVMKQLGTYVVKLRPMSMCIEEGEGWDEDEYKAEEGSDAAALKEEREQKGYEKRGIVWADGRMRPGYNAHVTVTGRLSSSSPINAQNFPKHLRKLIVAQPGNVLVGADADQLELRIAAARWGLTKYIHAITEGIDPHSMVTAQAIFGDAFMKCAGWPTPENGMKWTGQAYNYRQLAKIIQYAFQYKASVETGTRIIQSTEIEDKETGGTKMPYLRMGVSEVRQMRNAWLSGIPELEKGWDKEIQFFRDHGYIQEPVHNRKRFCLDGENPNELVNFPIQGSASGLINDAMIGIWRDIPLHKWGPGTGLLTQTHDALVVECPKSEAKWVQEVIEHHLNQTHPLLPGVRFTATADVGMSWDKVG